MSPRRHWAGFTVMGLRMSYEAGLAVVGFSMSALAWFHCGLPHSC